MNTGHLGIASIVTGLRRSFIELFGRYFNFDFGDWWVNYVFLHPEISKFRSFRQRHCATISAGIEANFHKYVARVRELGLRVIALNEVNAEKRARVAALNDLPVSEQASELFSLAKTGQMREETPCDLIVELGYFIIDGAEEDAQLGLVQQLCVELSVAPLFECMDFEHLMLCAPEVDDTVSAILLKHKVKLPDFADIVQAVINGHVIKWPHRSYPWS